MRDSETSGGKKNYVKSGAGEISAGRLHVWEEGRANQAKRNFAVLEQGGGEVRSTTPSRSIGLRKGKCSGSSPRPYWEVSRPDGGKGQGGVRWDRKGLLISSAQKGGGLGQPSGPGPERGLIKRRGDEKGYGNKSSYCHAVKRNATSKSKVGIS